MSSVKFHIVIKNPVIGKYFIFKHIKSVLEASSIEMGDVDDDNIKDSIELQYYTQYEQVPERLVLGFSIDFSILLSLESLESLPDITKFQKLIHELGDAFKDDDEVEGIVRFQDDFMLEEAIRYHREVYEIEMKIREILSYILTNNFSEKELYEWIKEFSGTSIVNAKMKKEVEYRKKTFKEYMENELFYIVFTQYGAFNKPKQKPTAEFLSEWIMKVTSFQQLQERINKIGITDRLNPSHKSFVNELSQNLDPVEKLRNEIMHNRQVKQNINKKYTQKADYLKAKEVIEQLINQFWEQERNQSVPEIEQAHYMLATMIESLEREDLTYSFKGLDGTIISPETEQDLKDQLKGEIEDAFDEELDGLEEMIDWLLSEESD